MAKLNLFIPQWQDSGHTNEIYRGSHALKQLMNGDLDFEIIPISEHDTLAIERGIYGYRVILDQLASIQAALERRGPDTVFTLGGGCGVEVPIISYLKQLHGNLRLFWFDAHGDINSPRSSSSKYFHGMPLRFLIQRIEGNEISRFVQTTIPFADIVLLGTRDLDESERIYIESNGIQMLPPDQCNRDEAIEEVMHGNTDDWKAYIHLDLDVIDPKQYRNVKCPAAGGLSIERISRIIRLIRRSMKVAGISILENMETDRRRLEKLRPLIDHAVDL
jgi:arginase